MKFRNGFVSNSSSSSFCIYGICVENVSDIADSYFEKNFTNLIQDLSENWYFKQNPTELPKNGKELKEYFEDEGLSDFMYTLGWSATHIDGSGYYIGRSWSDIGDDETGREFKKNIEDRLKEIFPDTEFSTYEEAYYS